MILGGCSPSSRQVPATDTKPVTDEYYGTSVVDNYRWLDSLGDPAVRAWNDAQNVYSRTYFDGVGALNPIRARLKDIIGREAASYGALVMRTQLFALKTQPPRDQPMIVVLPAPGDTSGERVIVDPNAMNPKGTTAIDWFTPSHDGRMLAVSLSENGSEDGTLHLFEVATGRQLEETVPRVQYPTASGAVEWSADNSGFYYTRYPQGNERPKEDANFYQEIYYHRLGTPSSQDTYVLGKEFPRIAECLLSSSPGGKYTLVSVANGDGGEFAFYLRGPKGSWRQVGQFSDKVTQAKIGPDFRLYCLSHDGAPNGKLLALDLETGTLQNAKTIVAEGDVSIETFLPTSSQLYVVDMAGGPSGFRRFTLKGSPEGPIPLEPVSSVGTPVWLGGDSILFSQVTYLAPRSWYLFDPGAGAPRRCALSTRAMVDFSDCEVVREFAVSKDGTRVPLNIIRKMGTPLDGRNPAILYGYGGYGISEAPSYDHTLRVWLEQGGIYAVANLRGGAEFGESWHEAGRLTKKQNVFDDFIACAQALIAKRYTSAERLAAEGGSNGGLLMGAVLTQRPDLFRAVVSFVGIYDMLRVELFPNGAFNVTEFGSVRNPEQFKALYAYSPYHHVVDGTRYPAVLFLTGDNDGRVDPANSRKMIARLQAASSSGYPLLLRTDAQAGHGIGTGLSARVAQAADFYAFLVGQLGVHYTPVE
jgi:prolyl oligopeptidase